MEKEKIFNEVEKLVKETFSGFLAEGLAENMTKEFMSILEKRCN